MCPYACTMLNHFLHACTLCTGGHDRATVHGFMSAVGLFRRNNACRDGRCNNSKLNPIKPRTQKTQSRMLCPANFKMVVKKGNKLCVNRQKRSRFQTRYQNGQTNKTGKELVQKKVKLIEKPLKVSEQTSQIKTFYDDPIIRKYTENNKKQRCRNDEVLVITLEGAVCKAKCEDGQFVRTDQGIKRCLNSDLISNKICPEGHKPIQTTIGIVCEKIPQSIRLAGSLLCASNERLIHLQTGPVCIRGKLRRPKCKDKEKLVQQGRKFYCVLPRSEVTRKCSLQEEEVHSVEGIQCRPKSCPQGLTAFKTPAGTICVFQDQANPAPRQERPDKSCAPGQTLIRTDEGEECWFTSASPNLETKCPPGQVLVGGTHCKDSMSLSPDEISCPPDQELVMSSHGAQCQFRRPQSNELYVQRTRCPEGQILTLKVDKFACHNTTLNLTDIVCNAYQVVVQAQTNILECVSEEQTNLICKFGWFLTRTTQGYTCSHGNGLVSNPAPSRPCDHGEVFVADKYGVRCVNVLKNSHLCAPGHQPIMTATGEIICKAVIPPSEGMYHFTF